MSHAVPTTTSRPSLDPQAAKILESLHGYMHRQEWLAQDRAFVRGLLEEWDTQVTGLLTERRLLRQRCAELEEHARRLEWRMVGQGWGHYLRFLLGFEQCPSR